MIDYRLHRLLQFLVLLSDNCSHEKREEGEGDGVRSMKIVQSTFMKRTLEYSKCSQIGMNNYSRTKHYFFTCLICLHTNLGQNAIVFSVTCTYSSQIINARHKNLVVQNWSAVIRQHIQLWEYMSLFADLRCCQSNGWMRKAIPKVRYS